MARAMHASYMEFNIQSLLESKVAPVLCSRCWYTCLSYWIAKLFKSYCCIRLYQLSVVVFSDKILIDILLINKQLLANIKVVGIVLGLLYVKSYVVLDDL